MRTLLAIITGCVGMLPAFNLPWSVFVGVPSEYTDAFSWIVTVLVYGAVYQFPLSVVLAAAVVWPAAHLARRLGHTRQRYALLAASWLLVVAASYAVGGVIARDDLATVIILCGIFATGVATFLSGLILRSHDTASHTTA